MAAPTIEVGVNLGEPAANGFILDDPVRGQLDQSTYVLSDGYSEVADKCVRLSIRRGRFTSLTDPFDAGAINAVFNNETRDFDPSYASSPYYGLIVPGRGVQVKANDIVIATGYVDDWDLEYDASGRSTVAMLGTDALGVLGQMQFDAWTSSGTSAADKLNQSLNQNEVDWSSTLRDFDYGTVKLSDDTVLIVPFQSENVTWGSNVLNYLQLIAKTCWLGWLFASADGKLTFRAWQSLTPFFTPLTSVATFGGTGIGYQAITAQIGKEWLYSRVGVSVENDTTYSAQVADVAAWQKLYGPSRNLTVAGTLLDGYAQDFADDLLAYYSEPQYRIDSITVELAALSGANQNTVLNVEIGDQVTVKFTPNGVGTEISEDLLVQGIAHEIVPASHRVTLSLIKYFENP